MKNKSPAREALFSGISFSIIIFIVYLIFHITGFNRLMGIVDTWPALIIRSVLSGILFYLFLLYWLKAKERKNKNEAEKS